MALFPISAAVFSHSFLSMSPMATLAPAAANAVAMARPMPRAPPVTATTLPASCTAVPIRPPTPLWYPLHESLRIAPSVNLWR
ncbi:Uncharacterised protein [Mycobacteroides abscessus subsp. abscessus]|nr:Uncharacterised protein [Mycobacteroides abscessus subsp. abscessus]